MCYSAAQSSAEFASGVFESFEGGARDTAMGWMLASSCLFDAALKSINPQRSNLTPREHSIIGACLFSRWSELHCTDRHLLINSLKHYERVLGGAKQVSAKLIEDTKEKHEGSTTQSRARSLSIAGDQGNDQMNLFNEACFNVATIHYLLGQTTPARSEFEAILSFSKQDFDRADLHVNIALCYMAEGDLETAMSNGMTALKLVPNHFQAVVSVGNLHKENAKYDEAVDMYRRALEVNPEDVLVMVRMAGALLAHGKADAAIAELKLACELECDVHGMAFNSLIKAYQYLGKAREISVLKLQQAGSETNSIKKRVFAFA
ncbi:hypothetical protein TrRE_jg1624, partial [Triparma retinervis]